MSCVSSLAVYSVVHFPSLYAYDSVECTWRSTGFFHVLEQVWDNTETGLKSRWCKNWRHFRWRAEVLDRWAFLHCSWLPTWTVKELCEGEKQQNKLKLENEAFDLVEAIHIPQPGQIEACFNGCCIVLASWTFYQVCTRFAWTIIIAPKYSDQVFVYYTFVKEVVRSNPAVSTCSLIYYRWCTAESPPLLYSCSEGRTLLYRCVAVAWFSSLHGVDRFHWNYIFRAVTMGILLTKLWKLWWSDKGTEDCLSSYIYIRRLSLHEPKFL